MVETDKSVLDDKDTKACKTSNGQVQQTRRRDSDPWAFLEHELDEFKRIVAELENLKLPANTIGNQGFCQKACIGNILIHIYFMPTYLKYYIKL